MNLESIELLILDVDGVLTDGSVTMTAEGARGDTAKEMGEVLRWPDAARRVGEDAQRLPFEMSRIHSGYTELERLFESAMETPAQQAMGSSARS